MSSRPSIDHDDLARIGFDLSPSGLLAVDGAGRIVTANREAEQLFGWTREELAGRAVETLVPERYRGAHPGHRAGFHRDPRSRPMGAGRDLHALRRDGSEFPVEIGLNPVQAAGQPFVLVSVVDITARRKLDEEQRRSQRLETIGVLAGGIAHDFNNLLLGIVGHTELALREAELAPQARDDLRNVLQAAERGRQLVQRILAFSRKDDVVRTPVRIERTVSEVLQLLRASLPSTIEIRSHLDETAPTVLADETQLHQVLMNLATNAAQAMPEGGTLEFRLEPRRDPSGATTHARIVVRDTGVGMTAEVLEHALEPFYTTKAAGEGTGLGLSVVHGIVRGLGGALEIASAPTTGTTVTIELPAGAGERADRAEAAAAPSPQRRIRILFVEDEAILATMQRRQLEHLGFAVTVHTSSPDALADFRARPDDFDLLLTDETMPRMTGTALTAEVLRVRPDLPVLMVSGGDRSDVSRPRPAGVRRVLSKPHTIDELEAAIREVMPGA